MRDRELVEQIAKLIMENKPTIRPWEVKVILRQVEGYFDGIPLDLSRLSERT